MTKFRISDLPTETKTTHESQSKWRRKNWQKTLKEHKKDIEKLLKKISLFDIWSTRLQQNHVAIKLIPEIFMDAYISIHFSGYGLYKYAYMCLRSELEIVLRLVFFSTHPVEFKWWSDENEWYRDNVAGDVWGRGYLYFEQLDNIKEFEKSCDDKKKLFAGKKLGIRGVYKTLSKFIHSGAGHFQTRADRVSPKYDSHEFGKWYRIYEEVQTYIHIIFALGFADNFKAMNSTQRNKIFDTGMDSYYKGKLKQVLAL